MNLRVRCGGAALFFSLFCGDYKAHGGADPVIRSHCGLGFHEVTNLNAVDPRRAYWCKSDLDGYLGEDQQEKTTRDQER